MSEERERPLIAIVPARGGSKRLPRKNILPLGGQPLLTYPVKTALASGMFHEVIVSSDDAAMLEIAADAGATALQRPEALATDEIHELEACAHVIGDYEDRHGSKPYAFCVIYPTAAFIRSDDLSKAFALLDDGQPADAVLGVSGYDIHPYKALVQDDNGYLTMMFPAECQMRSQFYPQCVASNGTFYWLRTHAFEVNPHTYQDRLKGFVMPSERAVDIDTDEDYQRAQRLFELLKERT